jgi:hypothetical protein
MSTHRQSLFPVSHMFSSASYLPCGRAPRTNAFESATMHGYNRRAVSPTLPLHPPTKQSKHIEPTPRHSLLCPLYLGLYPPHRRRVTPKPKLEQRQRLPGRVPAQKSPSCLLSPGALLPTLGCKVLCNRPIVPHVVARRCVGASSSVVQPLVCYVSWHLGLPWLRR